MSTIAAWFDARPTPPSTTVVETLLRLAPRDSDDRMQIWKDVGAVIGVARHAWQSAPELESDVLVARSDRAVVVCDGTLYGMRELASELSSAGRPWEELNPVSLILRSWEAWGDDCAGHLNGDFAFVVWDRMERRAILCRDLVGRRSLYTRTGPGPGLAVASRARSLALGIGPVAEPNLPLVAAAASALPGGARESGYQGIMPVPAGATMSWTPIHGLQQVSQWEPPAFQVASSVSMEDAASQLRTLLTQAVGDRIESTPSTIWLSGGADSTALFAVAMASRNPRDPHPPLQPISVSYPAGDRGREDEHILALTARWNSPVTWIESDTVPLFDGIEERATLRDDPFAHTFGPMNAALSRATRAAGACVALDGYGGDALFEVSRAYLADLLMAGDLPGWWRALHESGLSSWRSAIRWGILPALPEWMWSLLDTARRRPLQRTFEYPLVEWLTPRARRTLVDLGWTGLDISRRPGEGPAAFESRSGLIGPHFARALAATRDSTVPSGVEVRSPFMDRRVISLAASRPVAERAWQGNGKRLLKAAMKGLIPDSVLAPRPVKTGLAAGYLHRQFQRGLMERLQDAFGSSSALADHGLVEPASVLWWGQQYGVRSDHLTGVSLYLTLESEYWLRSR